MTITIKYKSDDEPIESNNFEELSQLENYNKIIYVNCSVNNLASLPDNLPNSIKRIRLFC